MSNKELSTSIQSLTDLIQKRSSYTYRIISWLITWAATAIWATVVAGIVIFSLGKIAAQFSFSDYPAIQNMLIQANIIDDEQAQN